MKRKVISLMTTLALSLSLPTAALADFIDTTGPTGTYYQYGVFATYEGTFKGGQDVDSYEDLIYVNRDGANLDVYQVTLNDSDGDGLYEPDQHPNNPEATGPIEQRTLTYVKTYDIPALNSPSVGEIYAAADRVYFLGEDAGDVYQYVFSTGVTSKVIDGELPAGHWGLSHLGYDDVNNEWYASSEAQRAVYKWNGSTWVWQFSYADLAGSHMDGLEVVTDPSTKIPYVYVSDMTSNYIGQWRFDSNTKTWVEENLFAYNDVNGDDVEGMGFGALNHFWVTGWGSVYEIGGGDISDYVTNDLSLTPENATNEVGNNHNLTATALLNGKPVVGTTVTFTVTGAHSISGTATTDSNGNATFSYAGSVVGTDTIVAKAIVNGEEVTSKTANCVWTEPPVQLSGRMTGGGSVLYEGMRVTHGFTLNSDITASANNFEVNWGEGNKFHLGNLTVAILSDDQAIGSNPPSAGFDTFYGVGTGTFNGKEGATIKFVLTDAGEPGSKDFAKISIKDSEGNEVLNIEGNLNKGNHQAHK